MLKIDTNGNYQHFPGVSIICLASPNCSDLCYKIYQLLISEPTVTAHYTPIPWQSYHMTTVHLYTQAQDALVNWPGFIDDKQILFTQISQALASESFNPGIAIKSLQLTYALQLIVSLADVDKQKIKSLAKLFGIEEKIPALFHITLAYQFKTLTASTQARLVEKLWDKISTMLAQENQRLSLQSASLCYFSDMTKFIPWNGQYNPFLPNTYPKAT